jgi:hypothetical protein
VRSLPRHRPVPKDRRPRKLRDRGRRRPLHSPVQRRPPEPVV